MQSDLKSDRSPEGSTGDVDRDSDRAGRKEGVESVPHDQSGAIPADKARQHDEPAPQDARKIVDERERIRETGHYGKN